MTSLQNTQIDTNTFGGPNMTPKETPVFTAPSMDFLNNFNNDGASVASEPIP